MLICKHQHNLTMIFTTNKGINQILTELFQIPTTPEPKKIYFQVRTRRTQYIEKRPLQSKSYKRYRQKQPRNRGTNHTLMRKGNTW